MLLTSANGHTYTYGNTGWRDLLTAFDGQSITYDASGNPTSYYNGTSWSFGWSEGRNLVSASGGGNTVTYAYDHNGVRTTKTVNGTAHTYIYASGKLLRETYGSNTLDFFYDASGTPFALKHNGTLYYYITNLQGDVMQLVNSSGAVVASYEYDPYGNIVSSSGSMASINPLRYRGYYYDSESGFYYLQSRYYDPAVGRFINADSYTSTGQGIVGHNMFSYCLCNPVNFYDGKGTDAIWIQEGGSAGYMGHSGLLVQDSEGNWWYFYWGPSDPNADFIGMCFYTNEICVFIDLNYNGSDIQNLEDVRAALQNCPNSSDTRVGEQADDITGILYLEGDYTNTYNYLSTLSDPDTLSNPMVQYSLFFNNCSQQTVRALSASNGAFLTVDSLIPNYAYMQAIVINNMQNNPLRFEIGVAIL